MGPQQGHTLQGVGDTEGGHRQSWRPSDPLGTRNRKLWDDRGDHTASSQVDSFFQWGDGYALLLSVPTGGHWRTGETGLHIGTCCVISAFCHHFLYLSRNFASLLCVGYILPFHHTVTHIVTAILTHPRGSGQGHRGDRKAFSIRTVLSLPLSGLLGWEEGT